MSDMQTVTVIAYHPTPIVTHHVDSRGRGTGMVTPWGKADLVTTYRRGVVSVGTAGHGGIGIARGMADGMGLSHAARAKAEFKAGYFWFEEDCRYAIAAWELGKDFWPLFFAGNGFVPDPNGGIADLDASEYRYGKNEVMLPIPVRKHLRRVISTWDADYFEAIGEIQDAQGYAIWTAHKTSDRLRAEKSPALITSAVYKDGPDVEVYGEPVTLVATADGKHHIVRRGSYHVRTPNLLADCDILDSDVSINF